MIKVGDKVKELPVLPSHKNKKKFVAVVTKVIPYNPDNPIEDHGTIEVKILKTGTQSSWHNVGDLEHYNHFNWEEYLKILPES